VVVADAVSGSGRPVVRASRPGVLPGCWRGGFAAISSMRLLGIILCKWDFCFLRETHNKKLDVWSFARFGIVFPVSLFILCCVGFALESATGEKYGSRI
jgi:hypothetical protein